MSAQTPSLMSTPSISREDWMEMFQDWLIVGCAVRDRSKVALVARKNLPHEVMSRGWDHDVPTKLFFLTASGDHGESSFEGLAFPSVGACRKPLSQALLANNNSQGQVFAEGSGQDSIEYLMPDAEPGRFVSIRRLVCIDDWSYAVCDFRKIYKRTAIGRWEPLMEGLTRPPPEQDAGFSAMHGSGEDNLYAVGQGGDVWHYNGKRWRRCDFPSNRELATVTVAPDGLVYISGQGGLWVGREDRWRQLETTERTVLYNDSVWFDGRLWLSSDYQLHTWDGKALERVMYKGERLLHSGYMDAHDGLLVVASVSQVHVHDGSDWNRVIVPYG